MMVYQPEKIEVSKSILKSMQRKPKVLVELGTYVGTSAVAWGAILKEINGEGDGEGDAKVYSIELDPLFVSIARDFISLAGLDHTVEIVNGQSGTSLKALKDDGKIDAIDVLFLDHWEKFYVEDLKICEDLGLLRVGSVIIADNTDMPGAPDYLEYVRGGGREGKVRYETETVMAGVERGPVCPFAGGLIVANEWLESGGSYAGC